MQMLKQEEKFFVVLRLPWGCPHLDWKSAHPNRNVLRSVEILAGCVLWWMLLGGRRNFLRWWMGPYGGCC